MTLDRGFAHIGVPPAYVGEMVLLPGLMIALVPRALTPALRSRCGQLYLLLAAVSLCCAVPYFRQYGQDTVRDSAIWVYGIFFLVVASLLVHRPDMLQRIPVYYGRFLLWYTPILCGLLVLRFLFHANDESAGGTQLFSIKLGDLGAHLGGVFAFLLLSLDLLWQRTTTRPAATVRYVVTGMGALSAFVFVSSINRGGMLAAISSVLVVTALGGRLSWARAGVLGAGAIVAIFLVFGAAGAEVRVSSARTLSLEQLETNVLSLVSPQSESNTGASNTTRWRLTWWKKIFGYTFGGPYFWTGKGYGVNLADSDGFRLSARDNSLRAPHNSNMTILARSGVPGFVLWMLLLLTFGTQMVRFVSKTRRAGYPVWSRVAVWCLAYWTAMVVDSCFDVALEGPQLGIWFWALMGYGVALQSAFERHTVGAIFTATPLAQRSHIRSRVGRAIDQGDREPVIAG